MDSPQTRHHAQQEALGKRVPPHLVEALRDMEEEPQEEQSMDVPMDEDA